MRERALAWKAIVLSVFLVCARWNEQLGQGGQDEHGRCYLSARIEPTQLSQVIPYFFEARS